MRRVLAVAGAISAVCSASALAQGPALRLDAVSNSTAPAGGTLQYIVQATNAGDVATDGSTIDVHATLAPGMTAVSAVNGAGGSFACTAGDGSSPVAGATVVDCRSTQTIAPTIFAGLVIDVALAGNASGVLTSRFGVSGGGAAAVSTVRPIGVSPQAPTFGVEAFDGQTLADASGAPSTQAGGHPYEFSTYIDFNTTTNPNAALGPLWPVQPTRDAVVDLPPGLVGDPAVAEICTIGQLASAPGVQARPSCPLGSQVGTVLVRALGTSAYTGSIITGPLPLYNLVPPDGVPAEFGFNLDGSVVTFAARVRSGGDYGLSVSSNNLPKGVAVAGATVTFWGVPADPSHDLERSCPGQVEPWQRGPSCAMPAGTPLRALLRNPTSCAPQPGGPVDGLETLLHIDSWVSPARFNADGSPDLSDPNWKSASYVSHVGPGDPYPPVDRGGRYLPTGCEREPFSPSLGVTPDVPTMASSPSGFAFDVSLPQSDDPLSIGESDLRGAVVRLPVGMNVSPSSADGLQGCTQAQIGLHSTADPACPDASKIGSVTLTTPLLAKPMTGAVYLAQPHENPFGTLLGMYVVAQGSGVTVKLAGKVDADPNTGQLTTTFPDNPQLPFSRFHLALDSGPRAPLMTPSECGSYEIDGSFAPWSGMPAVPSISRFTVDHAADGGACRSRGFAPVFRAGMTSSQAGGDGSFALRLARGDGDQELRRLAVYMPTGVTGRIANAVLCDDAAADAGTCGDGSRIGSVTVGAGPGPDPFYITSGRAYITGPYGGAPFGLSIVVPAVAGPFDLGNVVVRSAVFVDRRSGQLRIVSDPFPRILQGIPLDVRDVRVVVDRPHFMLNPTNCATKHVLGTVESVQGALASVGMRFGVVGCERLPLRPRLTLTIGGAHHTAAGASTPLTTVLTQSPGQANLRTVQVALPGTLNARLPVLNRACTLDQFNAGQCEAARAGTAVAVTPVLRDPLRGSAYFVWNRASRRPLPDLMIALRGQVAIDVVGKTGVDPRTNRLTSRFDTIPDIPITRFTLSLVAGSQGPLGNVSNLCSNRSRKATATIGFRGQNGALLRVHERLHILGCPRARP